MKQTIDIKVSRSGNLFLFTLLTEAAAGWIEENVETESWQWLGTSTLCVDQHYAENLLNGLLAEGFKVR